MDGRHLKKKEKVFEEKTKNQKKKTKTKNTREKSIIMEANRHGCDI